MLHPGVRVRYLTPSSYRILRSPNLESMACPAPAAINTPIFPSPCAWFIPKINIKNKRKRAKGNQPSAVEISSSSSGYLWTSLVITSTCSKILVDPSLYWLEQGELASKTWKSKSKLISQFFCSLPKWSLVLVSVWPDQCGKNCTIWYPKPNHPSGSNWTRRSQDCSARSLEGCLRDYSR